MWSPSSKARRAIVFLAVIALVIVGVAVVPQLSATFDRDEPTRYSEFATSEIVPERIPSEGVPSVDRQESKGLVVIDQHHGNRFVRADIQPLLRAIAAAGYRTEIVDGTDDFEGALHRADALVVMDPAIEYRRSEVDKVEAFVQSGGRLVMLGEPRQQRVTSTGLFATLAPADNKLSSLASRFGIEFGSAYLFNMVTNDGNYRNVLAAPGERTSVARGIDRVAFFTATHVTAQDGQRALVAVDGTRSVRGDAVGDYPVAVVQGNVLAIGDRSFLDRSNYNVGDNEQLIANIARFLTGGERTRTLRDYPYVVDGAVTVTYTSVDLLGPAQTIAADLREAGIESTVRLDRRASGADAGDVLVTTYDHLEAHDMPTGITARRDRVAVRGYESDSRGVIVVRAPRDGFGLVVAVDGPSRARRAASVLSSGDLSQYLIDDRTAVIRTSSAGAIQSGD